MKLICLLFLFIFVSQSGFCQSVKTKKQDDETVIITQKANKKYNLTATFYGINFRYGQNDETESKIIRHIVFRDEKSGKETRYVPPENSTEQAADFYFTDVWSPDEEYAILPLGKFEGFGIFEAKDALTNIKGNKYFDIIKVKSVNSGFFWHDFEKWKDDSTFGFRAGLDGDMFAFKYNIKKSELYCFREKCEEFDIGINSRGKTKPIKKGDIETLKEN